MKVKRHSPEQEASSPADDLALEQLVEQLQISAMSVSHREERLAAQRAPKKALEALRQQLAGAG